MLGATPVDFSVCPMFIRTWKPGLLSTRSAEDFDFFNPGLNDRKALQIEGKAGDLILMVDAIAAWTGAQSFHQAEDRCIRFDGSVSAQSGASRPNERVVVKQAGAPSIGEGCRGSLKSSPVRQLNLRKLGMKLIGMLPWD